MPSPPLELLVSHRPANFLERGLAVPFTAPALAGARVRLGGREADGFEVILPNPSGTRGIYIMPWSAARDAFRPSVHDHLLATAVGAMAEFTPAALRHAAQAVAAGGAAGRAARRAAEAAMAAGRKQVLQTHFHILLGLIRAAEPPGAHPLPPEREEQSKLEHRAGAAVLHFARTLNTTTETIAGWIEALATLFAPVGAGPKAAEALLPRLLAALTRFATDVEARGRSGGEAFASARLLARHAATTADHARAALTAAAELLADPLALARAWIADRAAITATITRADWLLDGWARVLMLWQSAAGASIDHAVLDDILRLVPHLPTDVLDGQASEEESLPPAPRRRTAATFRPMAGAGENLARNEALRALSLTVLAA